MSSCLWNLKRVDSPPFVTFEYSSKEYQMQFGNTTFDILFKNHLEKLHNLFEMSRNLFHDEKQILEKLIYKNWNSLRKEKSLQYMKKLKKLLNNFVCLKLDCFIETINFTNRINNNSKSLIKVILPSREVYEYLLVRLLGAFRLMESAIDLIRNKINYYLIKQIKNGVFLSNNILFLSNSARLYCLIKKYQEQIRFVYNTLREYINLFKSTSVKWSEEFLVDELPLNLLIENVSHQEIESDKKLELVNHEMENYNVKINDSLIKNDVIEQDLGEVLDRDTLEQSNKKSQKNKLKKDKDLNQNERKLFMKKLKIFMEFSNDENDKFRLKLKKFIKKKLQNSHLEYKNFLQDYILNDKKMFKQDLKALFDDLLIKKAKKKIAMRKLVIKIVKNLIK
ncbi:unnamed protein product [Brachionus calyciflorus]|uniref:Nucleolus and neural progenitor protein-like N-terminal domain-containing protein n=1 Tax=Brachionus calyciflorus TaxID=104777 RepID=A0A813M432_9BILA|nr:unnamed protein product [Brachionus calyciflorus]